MTGKQLENIVKIIKEKTKLNAFSIKINPDINPSIFDSKFGGLPYWDLKKEYPTTNSGEKLYLLAQFNFDKFPKNDILPNKGMLQFFVNADDDYLVGMDSENQDVQNTFRVVYHKEIDYDIIKKQIEEMNIPFGENEYLPVYGEFAVDVFEKEVFMGVDDYRFEKMFKDLVCEIVNENIDENNVYSIFNQLGKNKLFEELINTGHFILGYPYFTQIDPREYSKAFERYDTLLFQMDSDGNDNSDYVLWGDCGVANFFINSEDLKKCDFSKVLYNWDCC